MTGEYGTSIFCDDVRQEVDGKKTLVGVFGKRLELIGRFPIIMPVLGIHITLVEPLDSAKGPLNLKLIGPGGDDGNVILDVDLPEDRAAIAVDISRDASAKLLTSSVSARLSPLRVEQEGHFRVRAYKGDREIKLGSLLIVAKEPGEDSADGDSKIS